tara:strand:+ start:2964 stop:3107 length:144 start_codon:yes stop_codon:yes gene_type:complete
MAKITLPWMSLIRNLKDRGYSDSAILKQIIEYGEGQEKEISDGFKRI